MGTLEPKYLMYGYLDPLGVFFKVPLRGLQLRKDQVPTQNHDRHS